MAGRKGGDSWSDQEAVVPVPWVTVGSGWFLRWENKEPSQFL